MRILAFDPGGTTGWAIVERTQEDSSKPNLGLVDFGQEPQRGILGFLQGVLAGRDKFEKLDGIVFEGFVARPTLTDGKFTRMDVNEIIGAIRMVAHLRGLPCVEQPASCKPVGYGKAGWEYIPHNRKHWQDAAAHAAFLLMGPALHGPIESTPWPPVSKKPVQRYKRTF